MHSKVPELGVKKENDARGACRSSRPYRGNNHRGLEDPEDYETFEAAVVADHDATSAVVRELVLRLASLLWRLRRATGIETALFESAIRQSLHFQSEIFSQVTADRLLSQVFLESKNESKNLRDPRSIRITESFLRLSEMPTCPISRLNRYEYILWRQACQIMITLRSLRSRTGGERHKARRFTFGHRRLPYLR